MKDVPEYEGIYAVTKNGKVWSYTKNNRSGKIHNGKYLKEIIGDGRYLTVNLSKQGKHRIFYIHRLIAMTFIKNPENKREVNHIDGNKINNNVKNLEWSTRKENNDHAIKTGLHDQWGEKNKKAKLTANDVLIIRKLILEGFSNTEIAIKFNVSRRNINWIKLGVTWSKV